MLLTCLFSCIGFEIPDSDYEKLSENYDLKKLKIVQKSNLHESDESENQYIN